MMLEGSNFLKFYEVVSSKRPNGNARPPQVNRQEAEFHKLEAHVRFSSHRDVVEFVPAYEEITSRSRGLKASYGVIRNFGESKITGETDNEFPAWLLDTTEPEEAAARPEERFIRKGPVGYKRQTAVFELSMPRDQVVGDESDPQQIMKLIQSYLVTFEAALKLAITIVFEMEDGDFAVTHQLGEQHVHWYVYSSASGSPIAKMVYDDFTSKKPTLFVKMKDTILHSQCCSHCCESCILLPRTPEFVVRQKLLNKSVLKKRWLELNV